MPMAMKNIIKKMQPTCLIERGCCVVRLMLLAVTFDLRNQRREINGVNRWLHINFFDTFSKEYNLSDAQSKIATSEAD